MATPIRRLRPMSYGDIFDTAFDIYRSHFVPMLLVTLILTAILFSMALGVGYMLCFVGIILVFLFWGMVPAVFVVEGRAYGQAFQRSADLSGSNVGRIFMTGLLGILLLFALYGGFAAA